MRNNQDRLGYLWLIILIITACTPQELTVEANPGEIQTSMARSVAGTVTAYVETVQPTPRDTQPPSLIPTNTNPPIITKVMDSLTEDASCRTGPDPVYDIASYVTHGIPFEVLGTINNGTWYLINNTPNPDLCWIEGKLLAHDLMAVTIPVLTPPPTPTLIPPDFSISYLGWQPCYESRPYIFLLTNTGNTTWESGIVSINNASTGEISRLETNRFGTKTYLVPIITHLDFYMNSEKLDPGQTLSIPSERVKISIEGNVLATITLCSENDGGGLCVTKTLKFSP